jgi:hypothetical protein
MHSVKNSSIVCHEIPLASPTMGFNADVELDPKRGHFLDPQEAEIRADCARREAGNPTLPAGPGPRLSIQRPRRPYFASGENRPTNLSPSQSSMSWP